MYYLWWKDFLDDDTLSLVQKTAIDNQHLFVPTSVSTGEEGYRKSFVLWHYYYIDLYNIFTTKVRAYLPLVQQQLQQHFEEDSIELQMTVSGDEQYFKQHTDNGTPDTAGRRITYVYYFLLSEHKKFTGGDLKLTLPDRQINIQPNHNSIVFFPSGMWHELMPVQCETKNFEDGRHTLVGWVRGK